jgi:hypothetical protein
MSSLFLSVLDILLLGSSPLLSELCILIVVPLNITPYSHAEHAIICLQLHLSLCYLLIQLNIQDASWTFFIYVRSHSLDTGH